MVKFLKPGKAVTLLQGRPVIRKDSAKKSRVKVFLKLVNFTHLMPTRYTLDVDFKDVASAGSDGLATTDKKVTAAEAKFKTGKNRWFFTKLRF
ncbi:unnamed protein product [Alopecurus aequalis]